MSESGHTERLEAALDGKYRIERKLGEGGMASVYLAEDIKHERKVALKILRPELAAVIGAERFLSEIKTTANLQHPHILPLFDSGEAGGYLYYVMPYIDGETLREKLDREKQLGVEEAVRIARDVADALDYAHRAGVIHRDIKPGNILLHDGRPVVADFGIALAVSAAGGGRMTETGLSLGTPHYMSPEQASADRDLSPKSDVYSLGCVLYEMLAGQPPHTGPSAQSILVHILTKDVTPLTELRHTVPPNVTATVAKAIEKLPADRFESAKDFMEALGDTGFAYHPRLRTVATSGTQPIDPAARSMAIPWHRDRRSLAAIVVGVALAGMAAWGWLRPAAQLPVTRSALNLGDLTFQGFGEILVSPDGRHLAAVGVNPPLTALYWRPADTEQFQLIPGTDGARYAAFSPDGESLVFDVAFGPEIQRVAISGGAPQLVAVIPENPGSRNVGGIAWGDDENIVFTFGGGRGLYRVPAAGGDPEVLLPEEVSVRNPQILPGGEAVLFTDQNAVSTMILDLATDSVRLVRPGALDAAYVETGHIVYADISGTLWVAPFDIKDGEITGDPATILDGLTISDGNLLTSRFAVSRNGTFVYGLGDQAAGTAAAPSELVVVPLEGNERVLPLAPRSITTVRWSPDGASVAYSGNEPGDVQEPMIFVYNVELGTAPVRLTNEGENYDPVWSPDGERIAFASRRSATSSIDLFSTEVLDLSPPTLLLEAPNRQRPQQWLEGDRLVFRSGNSPFENDIWFMLASDSSSAEQYFHAEGNELNAAISPDGRLAAYQSNESGQYEIYVRSFPEPSQQRIVSGGGGGEFPQWSPDGSRIYFWREGRGAVPDSLFAANVQQDPGFAVLSTDFIRSGDFSLSVNNLTSAAHWDLHPAGDRFIVPRTVGAANPAGDGSAALEPERFLIVTNWFTEMRAALGEN